MKTYVIISHDRHRDDYAYIIECEENEIEKYIAAVWNNDFGGEAPYKSPESYTDGSGDYCVTTAIIKTIE